MGLEGGPNQKTKKNTKKNRSFSNTGPKQFAARKEQTELVSPEKVSQKRAADRGLP